MQKCRLDECPPGLFRFNGSLGYRNEYARIAKDSSGVFSHVEAYCFDTGEFFWGGAKTSRERAALIVEPFDDSEMARIACEYSRASSAETGGEREDASQ